MYLAKDRGKGTAAGYEAELHAQAQALEGLALRGELQNAIRSDERILHFQPTTSLGNGRVAGFEALVRWQHPVRGLIPPNDFIPMAEQTGLILPLGSWVLRRACEAAVELLTTVPADGVPLTMSVNVASAQLARPEFVAEVLGVLADSGFSPRQLILEITESVFVRDVASIVERLETLRTHGIQIAIDDFGTGYSTLAYLRNLPLDVLKVDKAFVDRVATNKSDATLAQTILTMSASMNSKPSRKVSKMAHRRAG
jgi:EAL domain-containing protein (putative c-di-GMP-specific phosphodiesterase class I)